MHTKQTKCNLVRFAKNNGTVFKYLKNLPAAFVELFLPNFLLKKVIKTEKIQR